MLQKLFGLVYLTVCLTGAHGECPVQLNPERVVVRYDSSVSVNCSTSVSHDGIGWEASQGSVPLTDTDLITWSVSNLREWDIKPQCFINYDDKQCEKDLIITVYKTPDSVSIRTVDHTGPMIEGKEYELLCDIQNVAPAQNLTVKWYKGQTLVHQTPFTDTNKKPVNKIAKLQITANRADDGAQYKCEAELELGADGPRPPPTSKFLRVTVDYKPVHAVNTVEIKHDGHVTLDCTVAANPAPTYIWHSEHLDETWTSAVVISSSLTLGNYTCTASNYLGKDIKYFIITSGSRVTFWAILLSGLGLIAALIISYVTYKFFASPNSII